MNTKNIQSKLINVFIIWLPFNAILIYSQPIWNNLTISVAFAASQHDDRTSNRTVRLSENAQGRWGTWQYGISAYKPVLNRHNFYLEVGLGYSLEHQTHLRPVDYCLFISGNNCNYFGLSTDNYKVHLVQFPVTASFHIVDGLKAELLMLPLIDVYKKALRPSGELIGEKSTIDFYSLEINPGIRYQINRIGLSLSYRLYQVKKIDSVLFNVSNKKLEDYNPLKFWFSVGYRLGNVD